MGACATKPGDMKVKGEAPLVVEDAAAPPAVAGGEKEKGGGVPAAAETDPADASRRRSLSDLLKEHAGTSNGETDQDAEKVVTEDSATVAGGAGAPERSQAPVRPSVEAEQDDTAEEPNGDPAKHNQGLGGGDPPALEEEKRVDPDSVQEVVVATAAPSARVADDATA